MASIQRRPDGSWRVRYREPSGVERAKHFDRKGDAERFRATVQADLVRGTYLDPDAGKVTFGEFAQQWLAGQTVDPSTAQALEVRLRVHLLPTFGGQELRAIRPSSVQAWLSGLQQQLAPSYVRVLLANLSGILRAAVDDALIARNPCQAGSVRAPTVPRLRVRPWTHEQVQAVVAGHPDRYRVVPVVAAGCGLRQGEVFGLRVGDVDFLRRTVHVRQQVKLLADNRPILTPPKGGKTREVPLPDTVATELAEHLRVYPPQQDGLVFTTRERRPAQPQLHQHPRLEEGPAHGGPRPVTDQRHARPAALLRLGAARGGRQHPGRQRVPRARRPGLHAADLRPPDAHQR